MTHPTTTTVRSEVDDAGPDRRDGAPAGVPAGVPDGDPAAVPDGDPAAGWTGGRSRLRAAATWLVTGLAVLLVLFALVAPNRIGRLTPGAFARIPVEGLIAAALVLIVPARPRRLAAIVFGLALGLLTVVKVVDMGFFAVLARPFDLVDDWSLFGSAVGFVDASYGRSAAVGAVTAAAVLTAAVLSLTTLAVRHLASLLAGLPVRRRVAARRTIVALGAAWVVCALFGAQFVAGTPVASRSAAALAYNHALQVRDGLRDGETFAAEVADDAFRDVAGEDLLTGLRGKDVIVAFIESYGRDAVERPELAGVQAVLGAGDRRLGAAGFAARSGFLTSPTAGGGSWLAHATLLSGLWIDNQSRHHSLLATDRLTLNGAFRRAGWRTVGVMPGVIDDWPEGPFFGNDRIYAARDLGYRGKKFSFATIPDQYTLSAFERLERARRDRPPLMAEIPLISSHGPWSPVPRTIGWDEVGDGSVFDAAMAAPDDGLLSGRRGAARVRAQYGQAIEYSLDTLISYLETYGDDDLVMVFLGDHQPAPVVTGEDASRDVPITIVSRDRAVLDRVSGWGWQEGLKPGPQAPVWPMNVFRDRFLTAFGR